MFERVYAAVFNAARGGVKVSPMRNDTRLSPALAGLLSLSALTAFGIALAPLLQAYLAPQAPLAREWSPNAQVAALTAPALQSQPAIGVNGSSTVIVYTDSRNSAPDMVSSHTDNETGSLDQLSCDNDTQSSRWFDASHAKQLRNLRIDRNSSCKRTGRTHNEAWIDPVAF